LCYNVFYAKTGERVSPKHEGGIPMKDNTTTSKKIQHQIKRFSSQITKGLSKPKKKFISQMLFGIQASRDIKLSNIARSLDEEIKLIKTENRLSRHIKSKDLTGHINNILIEDGSWRIKEDTVLALDLSDINKAFAKKMDNLGHVWDGSEGKVGWGYWICEVIGVGVKEESPIPLYSELYSQEAEGFESENTQIIKAIETVNSYTNGRGIWTMDRGADRKILVGELDKKEQRFVIRCKGDRDFKDNKGRKRKIADLLRTVRYTERYTVKIDKEGYTEEIELHLGKRNDLTIEDTKVSLVVVKGFSQEPMLLITNVDKTAQELLEIYLTRWKCEESFRFLKHEYHLEDVRVRRYTGLRNTVALIHAVFYFLSVYLGRRLRLQILLHKIIEKAKRFFEIPSFKYYAIADGIFRLLFNLKWEPGGTEKETKNTKQLLFEFN
jgi:hypothetical protein